MKTISIRQASLDDIAALAVLFDDYRQFYGYASDCRAARDFLNDRLEHRDSVIFLALQGSAPVGFAQLYPSFSSLSLGRTFILNDLFVNPHSRRTGVATHLIKAATDYARAVGAVHLSLSTATTNTTAQRLYQALGWQRDEQFLTYQFSLTG